MPESCSPRRGWPTTDPNLRGGWAVYLVGAVALVLMVVAVSSAIDWYGQPLPGALVGPDAVVSDVTTPDWDGPRQGLRYPDRIVAIEGYRLDGLPPSERGMRVNRVASAGSSHLSLTVLQGRVERQLHVAIERMDGASWWLVAGSLFFAGA